MNRPSTTLGSGKTINRWPPPKLQGGTWLVRNVPDEGFGVKVISGSVGLWTHKPITDKEVWSLQQSENGMWKLLRVFVILAVLLAAWTAGQLGHVAVSGQPVTTIMASDLLAVPDKQLQTAERLTQFHTALASPGAPHDVILEIGRIGELSQAAQVQAPGRGGSRAAASAIATPPAIPQQPLIRTIYNWGDDVAVITDKWMPSKERRIYSLATVDRRNSRIIPFHTINCDSYDDIGYSTQLGKIVVCGRGDGAQLYQLTEQGWTRFAEPILGKEFRCAVEGDRIAVISDAAVYLFSTSSTKPSLRISIAIPDFAVAQATALLTKDSILIAYAHGEFGGALYRVDLSQSATPTKLLDDNVKFLARSPSGAIWAASGIGHMGYEHGAMYRVDGPKPETVASVSGDVTTGVAKIGKTSGVEFPGLTEVAGLAFGDSDRPIVVFPQLGVFELGDDRFNARYRGSLFFTYRDSLGSIRIFVGSAPVGVVTGSSGELYVASRSLGVFWIRREGQPASIKQLIFERRIRHRRNLRADVRPLVTVSPQTINSPKPGRDLIPTGSGQVH
jgi:hypothetical protein